MRHGGRARLVLEQAGHLALVVAFGALSGCSASGASPARGTSVVQGSSSSGNGSADSPGASVPNPPDNNRIDGDGCGSACRNVVVR